jgi:hypothetical protein
MALGIKGDTLHLNLEYGKQVQPKKNKKNKKPKMIKRVQILEPSHCIQMVPLKYKEPKSVTKKRTPM